MMENLTPLAHNSLKDINAIEKLNESDNSCILELKKVLKKYKKEDKFGLLLLHKHFDIEEDEIMLESIDIENRILTTKPCKIHNLNEKSYTQTVWSFSNQPVLNKSCESFCPTDAKGNHDGYRDHY